MVSETNDFSDMTSNVSFDFPFTPCSSNPFQNPNFYHPYQYTPLLTPLHQYTPPPTPSHVYHHIQPPEPPYQFYTSPQTPYNSTSPMLITDATKCYLHQLDNKITHLDAKLAQISMSFGKKNSVTYFPHTVLGNVCEGNPEVCEDSTGCQHSMEVGENEQYEDKHNQIIQILEKMQKRLADLSNPVKEMSSNMVNPSSTTLTSVSFFDNRDSMSRVEKLIDTNKEDFKPLIVSQPAIYAPHMFDEIPEKDYMIQIPAKPLYAPNSVGFHDKPIEIVLAPVLGSELTNNDNETVYKLHEDERGKFEVLAESSEHICEAELLENGKFNVSLKCSDGDGSLCKLVCLDSTASQMDRVPRKELVNWNVFIPCAIKEFMLKESFNWFCYKSRNDVDCFTTPAQLVAYNRYLAFLKDREIRACSPKYGLLVKLTIANAIICFYIKHEIGGITPESMPPFSKSIWEEGAAIKAFKLVEKGNFQEEGITNLLSAVCFDDSDRNIPGKRRLQDNLSDLHAQVAANQRGISLIKELIEKYGLDVVQAYMTYVQANAEHAVREMLKSVVAKVSQESQLSDGDCLIIEEEDYMDDGSVIHLKLSINPHKGEAYFDFSGTSPKINGNWNAPKAVTSAAVIYCLRCLVDVDIPLNQGCLAPVKIYIPEGSFLSPSDKAAIVGGNVLTSQRVTDVVLTAFQACACSQGCMNNLTFGDDTFGYYETIGGGSEAGPNWDGTSRVQCHMTNTRMTDPEIFEQRYPVLLHQFGLRENSGGAGIHRGGDGLVREIEFRRPIVVSILSERRVHAPRGLKGGKDGVRGVNYLITKDKRRVYLGGKNSLKVPPASLPVFLVLFIMVLAPMYNHIIIPFARKVTRTEMGITHVQRIGTGLFLPIVVMTVASLIEIKRKKVATQYGKLNSNEPLPITSPWVALQYLFLGSADLFSLAGMMEFFFTESPCSLRSLATSLSLASLAMGYYLSSVLVSTVNHITSTFGNTPWLYGINSNYYHLDRFYWLMGIPSGKFLISNFTEATKLGRKKCFKRAVERCQVDSLSSFVISYSGGQFLVIDVSYLDTRKAEIIVIGVYYLPNKIGDEVRYPGLMTPGHRCKNLQLMVQMMLGASYLSAQWDNTMQLNTMQLKVQVFKRVVLSWYWSVTILVFDPGDTGGLVATICFKLDSSLRTRMISSGEYCYKLS